MPCNDKDMRFVSWKPNEEPVIISLAKIADTLDHYCKDESWDIDALSDIEKMIKQVPYVWEFLRDEKHVRAFLKISKNEQENRKAETHLFRMTL